MFVPFVTQNHENIIIEFHHKSVVIFECKEITVITYAEVFDSDVQFEDIKDREDLTKTTLNYYSKLKTEF